MKKLLLIIVLFVGAITTVSAQKPAEIKFDSKAHNFGTFSKENPIVSCKFTFTNVGDSMLVINQAVPSCGCTVPTYTREPIQPGQKGEINVRFKGSQTGHFKKSITVRTNGEVEMHRLYIEGDIE